MWRFGIPHLRVAFHEAGGHPEWKSRRRAGTRCSSGDAGTEPGSPPSRRSRAPPHTWARIPVCVPVASLPVGVSTPAPPAAAVTRSPAGFGLLASVTVAESLALQAAQRRCGICSGARGAWRRGWANGHGGPPRPPGCTGRCCSGPVSGDHASPPLISKAGGASDRREARSPPGNPWRSASVLDQCPAPSLPSLPSFLSITFLSFPLFLFSSYIQILWGESVLR